jgi:hypothetical protein
MTLAAVSAVDFAKWHVRSVSLPALLEAKSWQNVTAVWNAKFLHVSKHARPARFSSSLLKRLSK